MKDPLEHRRLRAVLGPYFKTSAIGARMDVILDKFDTGCQIVRNSIDEGEALDMREMFSRMTVRPIIANPFQIESGTD